MLRTPRLHTILIALTLLAVPGLRAATYVQNVLNAGPAAYWRFETVNDTSLSNGFVNTFQGNATVTAAGQGVPLSGVANNCALLLDGTNSSVLTGITNQFTFASNGTFMAWVNFNQLPSATGRYVEFVVKSHFSSPLDWVMDPNNRLFGYAGDYPAVYCDFNPALATNTWYHLAFTFDNAGGFKRLYVNGVLVGDLPLSPNLTGSADEIAIGNSPVFTDRSFNGRMDEVALFNRALSSAEIQTIFASAGVTTPAPQPVIRLSLEFPHEINALERGMHEYFGLGLNFTMIPAPFNSTNALYSTHTNFSSIIGGPSGGAFGGGGGIYDTLGEVVQEATNGLWTLVLNQGATNEQIYRFHVNVGSLSTNNYAVVNVTSPVDGSSGNAADVPFTWTQSKPWLLNNLELSGPTYANVSVPPGSTSWTNAPTLNLGKHDFNLYLRTNAASWISLTTPTNGASQLLANWDGSSQLVARRGIRFRVGYFIPPPPGLQAHLRFDDENNLGLDSSGSNNNADTITYDQWPTYNANGKLNGAVSFTHGGFLEFNDAFTPTLGGDFTVAVWVQTTQIAGNDTDDGINGAGIVGGFIGDYGATNTAPIVLNGSKAGFMTGDGNGEQTLHSTVNINTGGPGWVHVAVTRVRATGEKRLYIDGVLNASETGNTNLLEGTEKVRVGYGDYFTFNGLLDDLQIYSTSLSASDIAYLYANPGATVTNFGGSISGHTNVAHYAFDNSGDLGLDSSGNGNDMNGGSSWGPVHQFATDAAAGGGAVEFFGTSSITPSDSTRTNWNMTLTGSFSISAWVKTTASRGNDDDNAYYGASIFWAFNDQNGTNDTIPLAITGSKAAFTTRDGAGNFTTLHSGASVNDGNYHLISVTRNQSTGEKKVYVDGNFEASEIGTTEPLNGNNYYLSIGGTSLSSYSGLLDDVQIYSGVLSANEVAALYSNPGSTVTNTTIPLDEALNATNLAWTTSGDASWFGQTTHTHDNVAAAQSGAIGDNGQTRIETTVAGPGTLSFWWKVSSETNFDYLDFLIDGFSQNSMSGDSGWQQQTYPIGAGSHTLRWNYYKDSSGSDGLDAGFLDEVSFVATPPPDTNTPPIITVNPFSQTNHPGYSVALFAGATSNAAITWEWFKAGSPSPIANATNTLLIPANSGSAGVAGDYFAIATNAFGSATTLVATVTFQNAALPPDWSRAFTAPFTNDPANTTSDINLASLFDSAGNIYTVGSVNGTNVFGTNTLISANGVEGSSFLKQTATGTPIWGRCMTNNGNGSSFPRGIAAAPGDGFTRADCSSAPTGWARTNSWMSGAVPLTWRASTPTAATSGCERLSARIIIFPPTTHWFPTRLGMSPSPHSFRITPA